MGLLFLLVLGAILGWLSAIILHAESRIGLLHNIGAGIIGALGAGLLLSPLIGGGNLLSEHYSVAALMLALLGSLALIVTTNLVRGQQAR